MCLVGLQVGQRFGPVVSITGGIFKILPGNRYRQEAHRGPVSIDVENSYLPVGSRLAQRVVVMGLEILKQGLKIKRLGITE